jgi:F420H(2)-dependent quinone reductase
MGGKEIPVLAVRLTGAERDRVFRIFADYASKYDAYRGRTGRNIRVFALTRRP